MFHCKICVNDGFGVSKVVILMLQTRNMEKCQKIQRCGIASTVGWSWFANTKTVCNELRVIREAVSNRLQEMGKIHRTNRWVPLELNDRQMENRKNTCEILLPWYKKKSFLHHIVIGEKKWIYFENPKHKKSLLYPDAPSTSTTRPNRFSDLVRPDRALSI